MNVGRAVRFGAIVGLLLATGSPWAGAGYGVVDDGLVDWDWALARNVNQVQVLDHAVAPDGSLIVSTGWGRDGALHRIPPWGGTVDEHNRLGGETYRVGDEIEDTVQLAMRKIEIRGDRLFGLDHYAEYTYREHEYGLFQHARLLELDLEGRVLRNHGDFWNGPMASDPATGDFILQSVSSKEPFDHHLVRYDPDTRKRTILVRDVDPTSDTPLEVAVSPDGQRLFTMDLTTSVVDVRRPDGTPLYSVDMRQTMDAIVHGQPGTCFEGLLIGTRFDGSVWAIRPDPGAAPVPLATAGRPGAWSYTSIAPDGNILTSRLDEVTLLACAPFTPPRPPDAPELPDEVGGRGRTPAQRTVASGSTPSGAAPPLPGPAQPPVAGPAAPGAPQIGSMMQGNLAPQVGIADAAEEQPVMSMSAVRREPAVDTTWMRLALGGLFVTALAAGTFVVAREPRVATRRTS